MITRIAKLSSKLARVVGVVVIVFLYMDYTLDFVIRYTTLTKSRTTKRGKQKLTDIGLRTMKRIISNITRRGRRYG